MGAQAFERMNQAILDRVEKPRIKKEKAQAREPPTHQGELKVDATVAPQKIAYPTDLDLLNTARECTEALIDALHKHLHLKTKPRTYRKGARKAYLQVDLYHNSTTPSPLEREKG